jgi:hypothetical protein
MAMGPEKPGTKNDCAGEGQNRITRPTDRSGFKRPRKPIITIIPSVLFLGEILQSCSISYSLSTAHVITDDKIQILKTFV